MHVHDSSAWKHGHQYQSGHERDSERRTLYVVALAAVMMVVEVVCGYLFNSMALLADGWHMFTHTGALGIAAFAYFFARRQAHNPRFTFGTGKVNALGGFTSAVLLGLVAVLVVAESITRFYTPRQIVFNEAIFVAIVGLCVNLVSAWLLKDRPHDHEHDHAHGMQGSHDDHNLKAAYLHVLADAFTSVLAILALFVGKYAGWVWMDPAMGIVGSVVILHWAVRLVRETGAVLLDHASDAELEGAVRAAIEADADNEITDLHLWRIAPGKFSAIVSLATHDPRPPQHYKDLLGGLTGIVHVTVEVNRCGGGVPCKG